MRDKDGKPFEPDAMHVFDDRGRAHDASGLTLDVPRTWLLVKELSTAPEAPVQWIFMYEPIAKLLLDHAAEIDEPDGGDCPRARDAPAARRQRAPRRPPARPRVLLARRDAGCVDMGPMELLASWHPVVPELRTDAHWIDLRRWR